MERELGVTEARRNLSDIVDQVQHQGATYLLSRHGKLAAAVVPIEVYEAWQRQRQEFFDLVRTLQQSAGLSGEDAEQIAVEAVAAVRNDE